eukprot:6202054-Pleurochrysis_carterae.AAC.1
MVACGPFLQAASFARTLSLKAQPFPPVVEFYLGRGLCAVPLKPCLRSNVSSAERFLSVQWNLPLAEIVAEREVFRSQPIPRRRRDGRPLRGGGCGQGARPGGQQAASGHRASWSERAGRPGHRAKG